MFSVDRRSFLHQAANAGVAWGASSLLGGAFLRAQTSPLSANDVARVYVDSRRVTAPLDRNLFGSFLEHLGRAIYEGVYDQDRKSTRLNSSHGYISYAVFCLKKKKNDKLLRLTERDLLNHPHYYIMIDHPHQPHL